MASVKNITMREYNGTDYDTLYPKTIASQVDGVYKMDLLWENASFSSSFGEQTIQIDFSGYDSVRIDYGYRTSVFIPKLNGGILAVDASFVSVEALNGRPYLYFASRRATIANNLQSITFDGGYHCACNNGSWGDLVTPTPYLKPYQIYGIKL